MVAELEGLREAIENSIITLATVTPEGNPYAILVMYAKLKDDKIIITDNYMETTVNNLTNNKKVCIVFSEGEDGWRIKGEAEYFDSGIWLDYVKSLEENEGLPAKGAVVINVSSIDELG